ncbi:ATP-binding protein [Streptomyces sp. NPDC058694]|uniref:ATP-binding protein n=1 Tax=unclassified Streptomyces TaxID=2593676 RepID=UPI00364C974E
MKPAAAPAPVSDNDSTGLSLLRPERPQKWNRTFSVRSEAVRLARLHARTRLAIAGWPGDQEQATQIVVELMKNAIEHVRPQHPEDQLVLNLIVAEDETLLIAVTDPSPTFPDFLTAITAQKSTGLAAIRELGGETTWRPSDDGDTKTVQVLIRHPSPAADSH